MDQETQKLYDKWLEEHNDSKGTPWPILQIKMRIRFGYPSRLRIHYKEEYRTYRDQGDIEYAEAYRILGYSVYGYGKLSNNDRRRNGLHSLRRRYK